MKNISYESGGYKVSLSFTEETDKEVKEHLSQLLNGLAMEQCVKEGELDEKTR